MLQTNDNYSLENILNDLHFGESELATRIKEYDWSKTNVGDIHSWPQNLRIALSICLTSQFPMHIWWGEDLTLLYNDAYISFLGHKHPAALGQSGKKVWAEVWSIISPMIAQVFNLKKASWCENIQMFFARKLPQEEVYVTFSFSPIFGHHKVDGLFCAYTETTEVIVTNRRLETLSKLGVCTTEAKSVNEACKRVASVLNNNLYDVPFSAIYTVNQSSYATLRALSGISANPLFLSAISLSCGNSIWPVQSVLMNQKKEEIDLNALNITLPGGPWSESSGKALVLPIPSKTANGILGLFIVGVSPRRVLDQAYYDFFDLVAEHIGTAIVEVQAYDAECKRAEELVNLNKAKTIFFSNISHEFRTPLTLILAPLEDMIANLANLNASELHSYLYTAHRNAIRLLKLVNTFLDFSRIETQCVTPKYELTNFPIFMHELATVFRPIIERAGLKYTVAFELLSELVCIDREMWEKIIFNLLSNALKFTFQGEIKLTLKKVDSQLIIAVSDTGIGVDAKEIPRLFERFYRVERTKARTYEGSGIGLALVHELVRMQGGELQVKSKLNEGAEFTIYLPFKNIKAGLEIPEVSRLPYNALHAAAFIDEAERWLPNDEIYISPALIVSEEHDDISASVRILIVDDNADMRDYLARLLGSKWIVETAADGTQAFSMLHQKKFNLVLTDIMMPVKDGIELLNDIRSDLTLHNIPVIMISARTEIESRVEGLEMGANDYLIKPFSPIEVLARVGAHLKLATRHQLAAENELLRKAKEEADKNNRKKDLFLATLSHELRTPITAILCWAQTLKNKIKSDDKIYAGIHAIEESALVQKHMINDLLDVSSIVLEKIIMDSKFIDIISIIQSSIEAIRLQAEEKNISIDFVSNTTTLIMFLDEMRMKQVFCNLLINAIKFSFSNAKIEILVEAREDEIQIQIKDSGQGIKADFLPYIFDRFAQADFPDTQSQGGLGIGLALTRSLLELQGGKIHATSEGVDKGSIFTISFPKECNHRPL